MEPFITADLKDAIIIIIWSFKIQLILSINQIKFLPHNKLWVLMDYDDLRTWINWAPW